MQLVRNLARMLAPDPVNAETSRRLVYRVPNAEVEDGKIKDAWEKRIIDLSDGRSVGEINEILYREEMLAGASVVDIGLWKGLFFQSVVGKIGELASRGYIRLVPGEAPKEERNGQG